MRRLVLDIYFLKDQKLELRLKRPPKIWSDRAGFDKAIAEFAADTAGAEKIMDLDGLKAAFGTATENCGSCHKAYRIKKKLVGF